MFDFVMKILSIILLVLILHTAYDIDRTLTRCEELVNKLHTDYYPPEYMEDLQWR